MSWVSENVLVANPRDIGLFIKVIKNYEFAFFAGLNTLFIGLMDHPDCKKLDFSHLRITLSGGTTFQMQRLEKPLSSLHGAKKFFGKSRVYN